MQSELRQRLMSIRERIGQPEIIGYSGATGEPIYNDDAFSPSYIVTAVKLPTGAIEIATNKEFIAEKIDYILEAYDEDMCLKTNKVIKMLDVMVV